MLCSEKGCAYHRYHVKKPYSSMRKHSHCFVESPPCYVEIIMTDWMENLPQDKYKQREMLQSSRKKNEFNKISEACKED